MSPQLHVITDYFMYAAVMINDVNAVIIVMNY